MFDAGMMKVNSVATTSTETSTSVAAIWVEPKALHHGIKFVVQLLGRQLSGLDVSLDLISVPINFGSEYKNRNLCLRTVVGEILDLLHVHIRYGFVRVDDLFLGCDLCMQRGNDFAALSVHGLVEV